MILLTWITIVKQSICSIFKINRKNDIYFKLNEQTRTTLRFLRVLSKSQTEPTHQLITGLHLKKVWNMISEMNYSVEIQSIKNNV